MTNLDAKVEVKSAFDCTLIEVIEKHNQVRTSGLGVGEYAIQ